LKKRINSIDDKPAGKDAKEKKRYRTKKIQKNANSDTANPIYTKMRRNFVEKVATTQNPSVRTLILENLLTPHPLAFRPYITDGSGNRRD
jgi:hypothetical protein